MRYETSLPYISSASETVSFASLVTLTVVNSGISYELLLAVYISYWHGNPRYKPKPVWWPSELYNGNPYTNMTVSSKGMEA